MSKVVGVVAGLAAVVSTASAQEIGMVTLKPNPRNGEMYADVPARPDGEKLFIIRDGNVVTEASIKSSGTAGGTVISIPTSAADKVKIGDRISLSDKLDAPLPAAAYKATVATAEAPASTQVAQVTTGRSGATVATDSRRTETVTTQGGSTGLPSLGSAIVPPAGAVVAPAPVVPAPLPPALAPASLASVPAPLDSAAPGAGSAAGSVVTERTTTQLEKGDSYKRTYKEEVTQAVSPRLTPRGTGLTTYARPAVQAEAGIVAPYGVGLAAAAPVGTPYLRSPAFAGPPIIYMPQTVTRVLLPGVTPYPANIMAPPARYAYSSAPFLRTDIYTDLPYGTFYWPQGYAGTTPVEPQVPAYVLAPSTAILTSEASYTTQRYAPGLANPETLSPITVASSNPGGGAVAIAGPQPATVALTPAPVAAIARIPAVQSDAPAAPIGAELSVAPVATPAADAAALQPLSPFPSLTQPVSPSTGTNAPASMAGPAPLALTPVPTPNTEVVAVSPDATPSLSLPALPGISSTVPAPAALPSLPAVPGTGLPALGAPPALPAPGATAPAAGLPSIGGAAPAADPAAGIVVDDKVPGALVQEPNGAWEASSNMTDSHEQSSLIARVDGTRKTATFVADVPADGEYEVLMWWVASNKQFRSTAVPVTVQTAAGPQTVKVDQTLNNKQFNSVGRFALKAGQKVPVVTVSTEGLEPGPTMSVSVDAIKLVKVQ